MAMSTPESAWLKSSAAASAFPTKTPRRSSLSSHRHLAADDFVRRTLEETPAAEIHPERWLTGNDLQELGFQPGPRFSQILHALEDAQLEGLIKSKEAAIAYVDQHFGAKTGRIKRSSFTSN